jgi:hypothetical protein
MNSKNSVSRRRFLSAAASSVAASYLRSGKPEHAEEATRESDAHPVLRMGEPPANPHASVDSIHPYLVVRAPIPSAAIEMAAWNQSPIDRYHCATYLGWARRHVAPSLSL